MGRAGDTNHIAVVVNDVNDAVVPGANAPEILVCSQLLAAERSWLGGEALDLRHQSRSKVVAQVLDLPSGGWFDFEGASSQADGRA